MISFIRLLGKLPVPKGIRLSWQSNMIDRSFRKSIAKLRASEEKGRTKLQRLQDAHHFEMSMIYEEQDAHYTKQLIRQARRLRVHVPDLFSKDGQPTEFWKRGHTQGLWYLTDTGVSQVRTEIRKELKWRYERRTHYTAWVTGIIGILGTTIGFVVGLLSKVAIK
jgi:hypothetical protein